MPSRSVKLTTPKQCKANMDASIELHGITANSLATKTSATCRKFGNSGFTHWTWPKHPKQNCYRQQIIDPPNQDGTLEYLGHITSLWLFEWHPSLLRALPVGKKRRFHLTEQQVLCDFFGQSIFVTILDKHCWVLPICWMLLVVWANTLSRVSLFALSSSKGHSPKLHPADCKITFKMWQVK